MSKDLEDKVMEKQFSFSIKDLKWVITTLVAVVLWLVTAILWFQDREKLDSLSTDNGELKVEVATLQGQIKGVENASTIFMQNPPSELKFRIDGLENRVNRLELPGSNPPLDNSSSRDTSNVVRRGH